jgi:hypothetical protein
MTFTTSESRLTLLILRGVSIANSSVASRFGNFIGEEVGSEEASERGPDAGDYGYGDDISEAPAPTGQELMEIDGQSSRRAPEATPSS